MPTVEITVNGRRHSLNCAQGEESRLRQLATYLDRRIADLAPDKSQIGDTRLLVMAGLVVADELSDAYDEIKRLRAGLDQQGGNGERQAASALEEAARRIEAIAAALESA
ncbi:MAG TPA: cell division protein ZapA [Geminicoccaceae bacterium]|nr:cell division protein ZapA [Geminicoccaceae bacterium]